MRATRFAVVVVLAMASACGTDPDPASGDDEPATLDPAPPEGGQQLATGTTKLAPGEEKYMCYQFYSPADAVAITRVDTLSQAGVHHIGLYQAFGRDESPEPHECNVLIKQTWMPIFASGTGAPKLILPTGAGFVIQPGTQYIIQLHLQNTSDDSIDVRAGVNLTYDHNPDGLQPAGIYAFGTFNMEVPANTSSYDVPVPNCVTGKEMNVFGLFPHMHKYGKSLSMTRTPEGGAPEMLYEIDPWSFGDQPVPAVDIKVAATDRFDMNCNYRNETDAAVPYGESSDQEMCFFVMFYYPFDSLGGCVIGS